MIFVSNQFQQYPTQQLEQHLMAFCELTQSLSEEFDRTAELQAQTIQTLVESGGLFLSDLSALRTPQDFFVRASTELHKIAEQQQQYLQAAIQLGQNILQKSWTIHHSFSPILMETMISTQNVETSQSIKDINQVELAPINSTPSARKTVSARRKANTQSAETVELKVNTTPRRTTQRSKN
ncbi:phasin family protein [Undibacterium fentianense]|uniref:Phasin family protein n=1 Tax=Undibacterium fentianense TaxID=2828728 RepID=A0A941IEP5_9BURK|nr:phasin family protein [Undibacterium fentianense]MBR7801333.1 phasin family protein [Undibacterium fentianense]